MDCSSVASAVKLGAFLLSFLLFAACDSGNGVTVSPAESAASQQGENFEDGFPEYNQEPESSAVGLPESSTAGLPESSTAGLPESSADEICLMGSWLCDINHLYEREIAPDCREVHCTRCSRLVSVEGYSEPVDEYYYDWVYDSGKVLTTGVDCIEIPGGVGGISSSSTSRVEPSSVVYGNLPDSRDGKIYKTVVIGSQTWMAENLNYVTVGGIADDGVGSRCYGDIPDNCNKWGRLYFREAALNVCPVGWHLPSNDEWKTLFAAVTGGTMDQTSFGDAGDLLKSRSSDWMTSPNSVGTGVDVYGFSVLPAGYYGWRDGGKAFDNAGIGAYIWSSTEKESVLDFGNYDDCFAYFYYNVDVVNVESWMSRNGNAFSVRCVMD